MTTTPDGYLGADTRIAAGPAPELVEAGYQAELADAPLLHRGLGLADLAHVLELHDVGVIPPSDMAELLRVLLEFVRTPADAFPYDAVYGDAYNSRERELERRLGKVAGWLHTRHAVRAAQVDLPGHNRREGAGPLPWWPLLAGAAIAGPVAGVLLGLAAIASGGPLGGDRMAQLGPVGWQVALAATLVVMVGTLLGTAASRAVLPP